MYDAQTKAQLGDLMFGSILVIFIALWLAIFILARKRMALFWTDIVAPFSVLALWVVLTGMGYGHQSMSHLVEIPIVLIFSLAAFYFRVFVVDIRRKKYRQNSFYNLVLSLLFVLVLRTFMPFIPE